MISLFNLPPELLNRVVDFTEPSAHFNLALTSKLASQRLRATIEHHKKCHSLRVTTDILPSTLPSLLRGGKPDTAALWHVRTIEFWSSRSSWTDWKPHELIYPEDTPKDRYLKDNIEPERPYGPGHFTQDELDNFMIIMERDLHFDHSTAWKWRSSIEAGCDLALKGILVALCPRVQTLRLICEDGNESTVDANADGEDENIDGENIGDEDDDDDNGSNINGVSRSLFHGLIDAEENQSEITRAPMPHELFLRFIGKSIRLAASPSSSRSWPPGFASLRHVAVGVTSRARHEEHDYAWLNASAVAPLFALPSTKSLYLAGIAPEDADASAEVDAGGRDPFDDPTLSNSSVERLFIDRSAPSHQTIICFMLACNLTMLAFQHCEMGDFDIDQLHEGMPSNMEDGSLLYFSTMSCQLHGYRSELSYPDEFWPLSTVSLGDLYLCGHISDDKCPDPAAIAGFKEYLGQVLEVHHGYISIQPVQTFKTQGVDEMELLDDALTHVLRTVDTDCKGIFLDNIEQGRSDKFCFRKAIMAGRSKGVEIVTAASPISEELQAMVPRGETDADIESSPWRKHPSFEYMVAHHSRGIEQAGCNSCGKCEVCYSKYPKEMWEERDRGEYFTMENFRRWRKEDKIAAIAAGLIEEDGRADAGSNSIEDSDADSWEDSANEGIEEEENGDERSEDGDEN